MSIPGFGPDVSSKVLGAIGNPFRFASGKQKEMLRSISKLLRPGGTIVYSVCSTEPEEGEEVIKEFLKDSEDFYIIDTTLAFLKGFMNNGFLRTFPHINDMDGFFGVRLCKRA